MRAPHPAIIRRPGATRLAIGSIQILLADCHHQHQMQTARTHLPANRPGAQQRMFSIRLPHRHYCLACPKTRVSCSTASLSLDRHYLQSKARHQSQQQQQAALQSRIGPASVATEVVSSSRQQAATLTMLLTSTRGAPATEPGGSYRRPNQLWPIWAAYNSSSSSSRTLTCSITLTFTDHKRALQ